LVQNKKVFQIKNLEAFIGSGTYDSAPEVLNQKLELYPGE
jgi:hypothetical protein